MVGGVTRRWLWGEGARCTTTGDSELSPLNSPGNDVACRLVLLHGKCQKPSGSAHFDDWLLTISFLPSALRGSEPPLQPFTPAPCQLLFGYGTLFGIHTHLKWTRQGQFLSTPGVLGEEVMVGGGRLAQTPVALRGSTWQIIDLSGKKWQRRHFCECSDCYRLTTWLGDP